MGQWRQKRIVMMLLLLRSESVGGRVKDFVRDVFDADGVAVVDEPFSVARRRLLYASLRIGVVHIMQKSFQQ